MTTDTKTLLSSIRAGEDTELELKEVVFRGDRIAFGSDPGRASSKLAEVFVSMANTRGGTLVMGVRDTDRVVVGVDPRKRDLLEQFVVNVATTNCNPMIVPGLDWEYLPDDGGEPRLCLIIDVPASRFDVHQTGDGRFLQRIGTHRHLIPPERLARLLSGRRLTDPIEERPVFGSRLDDLHDLRLETYFRNRFPEWTRPDDWTSTLLAHKLAAPTDAGVIPTHLGVLLFAERPETHLPGAYISLAAYRHAVADGNTSDSRQITGPLPEQIGQVLTYFGSSPLIPTVSRKGPDGRHDFPSYVHTAAHIHPRSGLRGGIPTRRGRGRAREGARQPRRRGRGQADSPRDISAGADGGQRRARPAGRAGGHGRARDDSTTARLSISTTGSSRVPR